MVENPGQSGTKPSELRSGSLLRWQIPEIIALPILVLGAGGPGESSPLAEDLPRMTFMRPFIKHSALGISLAAVLMLAGGPGSALAQSSAADASSISPKGIDA